MKHLTNHHVIALMKKRWEDSSVKSNFNCRAPWRSFSPLVRVQIRDMPKYEKLIIFNKNESDELNVYTVFIKMCQHDYDKLFKIFADSYVLILYMNIVKRKL